MAGDALLWELPVGISICDSAAILIRYNERAAKLWGREPEPGEPVARYWDLIKACDSTGRRLTFAESPVAEVLRTRQPVHNRELLLERPDGRTVAILANVIPLFGDSGIFSGALSCFQDISELHDTREAVRESAHEFHNLLDALPVAVYTLDMDGRIMFFNRAAEEMWGRAPELGVDRWCGSYRMFRTDGSPLPHEECPAAIVLKQGRPLAVNGEIIVARPDGRRSPVMAYPAPLYDRMGKQIGAVNMLVDVSERKDAEARQKLLLDELNHRVKNTLATVQAIAAQTVRGPGISTRARDAFEARLMALSHAHNLLTDGAWKGATLHEILAGALRAFDSDDGSRVVLAGPNAFLGPNSAVTLALVFHELGTNAMKYGALSAPGGKVTVQWDISAPDPARKLRLEWRETGGPQVAPSRRRGFGSRLIERSLSRYLGNVQFAFPPEGVYCSFEMEEADGYFG